jgi:2-alkenal reductase
MESSVTPASLPVAETPLIIPTGVDYSCWQDRLVQLYEEVSPGVVAIRVLNPNGGSLGSGFVFDKDGHIVTNYHVIENQVDLEVAFTSGKKYRGWVSGADEDSDLAVIRIEAPEGELSPLPLGSASQTKVGQIVVAIGNPFGLEGTMTIGIVSGKGRTLKSQRTGAGGSVFTAGDIIQTDAAVNPGNSGGPLLNLDGEVIGVNESILTSGYEQPSSGVAFAISVDMVRRIVPELIENGEFNYPYLGIFSLGEITLLTQEVLGLPRSTGVYVTNVAPGSPADRAGIRAGSRDTNLPGVPAGGDLIIAIDGHEVLSFNDMIVYLTLFKRPGDLVVLTILRGGEELELEFTLDERLK